MTNQGVLEMQKYVVIANREKTKVWSVCQHCLPPRVIHLSDQWMPKAVNSNSSQISQ